MKKLTIVALLIAFCFMPTIIIGYKNRPTQTVFANHANLAVPNIQVAAPIELKIPSVTIPSVTITSHAAAAIRRPIVNKVYVCRDTELLSGGFVRRCEWM